MNIAIYEIRNLQRVRQSRITSPVEVNVLITNSAHCPPIFSPNSYGKPFSDSASAVSTARIDHSKNTKTTQTRS